LNAAVFLLLFTTITLAAGNAALIQHTFSFTLPAGAIKPQSMNLAGDFNGWSPTANAMREKDGVYSATVALSPGVHQYKFVVDGNNWIIDPAADVSLGQPDGQGGNNSGVNITADAKPPAAAAQATANSSGHTFTYTADPGADKPTSVNLAGDFNGWSTTQTPMTEKDGVFSVTVPLTPGPHQYKFVLNGTDWINDPAADHKLDQPDGQGGSNSVIVISPDGAVAAAPAAAGASQHTFQYSPPAGTPAPTSANVAGDFNGWSTTQTPMTEKDGVWKVTVTLTPGVHQYKFFINGSDWINDPSADAKLDQPDGQGGNNSGVNIGGPSPDIIPPPTPPAPDKPVHASSGGTQYQHEFYFAPTPGGAIPSSVGVAGDFNGWNSSADIMHFTDGAFRAQVPLAEGVHLYKFVVDGQWTPDPRSDTELEESDGFGGKNSAVLAGPDGRKLPPPQPNSINRDVVNHDPDDPHECDVVDSQHVRLGIRCQANGVEAVNVIIRSNGSAWSTEPLYKSQSRAGIDRFATLVTCPSSGSSLEYVFELVNGSATLYLGSAGPADQLDSVQSAPFTCNMQPAFETPDWAKHAVWYQIFPERFRNGDSSNDPPNTMKWTSDWWSTLPGESGQFYHDVWKRRYGGDFQGIKAELPYLRSLGVNAIYLNPIFKAEDLHKYDTSDYRHVDDYFGFKGDIAQLHGETDDPATWQWTPTDKLFLNFLADAHRQGFKVIIDGVFNHTGKAFYAFQDVVQNGKNSRYADWYRITSWDPLHWVGWGGDKDGALPEFRKDNTLGLVHGPRELIMNIGKRWLAPDGDPSKGVDGFRLDAAENVPHAFWIDFRKMVKSVKPDALIDGEIWTIAPAWLSGDQFDCTMDYPFAQAMQSFFVDQKRAITPAQFAAKLGTLSMAYPYQVMLCEQNLLDSHDTDRWSSRFVNPDLNFNGQDRIQDSNADYNRSKPDALQWTRMMQSLVVQFTYAGAPMVYYGDETGMWSPADPSDREPMIWKDLEPYDDPQEQFNQPLFDWYQRLIAIHNARPELQNGFVHTILADDADGVIAIERDLDAHHSCVVVNRSAQPHDIAVTFGPRDRDVPLANWLDDSEAKVSQPGDAADGRPEIISDASAVNIRAAHGTTHLTLAPWGSAILSADWN
jgi:glycosidase